MTKRSIMIMAGGTGGHIMPGLAVADVLRSRGWQVTWLGNPKKMEGRLVPPRGFKLMSSAFQGVRGKGLAAWLKLPLSLASACVGAWRHFDQVRPDVVLGMGGYVAFPGGLVARLRGVPLVVHEQNAVAGTANRLMARLARAVLTGFPNVLPRGHHVGNPVRLEVCLLAEPAQRYATRQGALRMLVLGGSLGAHILNTIVPQALGLLTQSKRPLVKHQSGEQHIDTLQAAYMAAGIEAECVPFIADIAQALGQADLVICRAGAMTVAEVAAAGVAALFVPLPTAIDNHQNVNAAYLSDAQAAWRQAQSEFTAQWLADWLGTVTRAQLNTVAIRARARARTDSADLIADVCERTISRKQ